MGRIRSGSGPGPDDVDDRDLVLQVVEDDHGGWPDHDRVRHADRARLCRAEPLHLPDHVVAEIAEEAGRHRRQPLVQLECRFGHEPAKAHQRRVGLGHETLGSADGTAIDLRLAVTNTPDEIRRHADHRVAATYRAALDRFQQERRAALRRPELGEGRDGGQQVALHPSPDREGPPRRVAAGKAVPVAIARHARL
jgi:hypothetical protein